MNRRFRSVFRLPLLSRPLLAVLAACMISAAAFAAHGRFTHGSRDFAHVDAKSGIAAAERVLSLVGGAGYMVAYLGPYTFDARFGPPEAVIGNRWRVRVEKRGEGIRVYALSNGAPARSTGTPMNFVALNQLIAWIKGWPAGLGASPGRAWTPAL